MLSLFLGDFIFLQRERISCSNFAVSSFSSLGSLPFHWCDGQQSSLRIPRFFRWAGILIWTHHFWLPNTKNGTKWDVIWWTYNLGSQTTRCAAAFSRPYPLRKPGELYKNRFSKDILTKWQKGKIKRKHDGDIWYVNTRDMFQKFSNCAQGSNGNFCHASRLHRCPLCCRSCHWCGALWQGGGHRYRWGRRRWWPASHVWHEGEIETMNS